MKKQLLVAVTLVAVFVVSMVASAQVKKGKTRAALTKQIMGGIMRPNCGRSVRASRRLRPTTRDGRRSRPTRPC